MSTKEKVRKFIERFVGRHQFSDSEDLFETRIVNSLFSMQLVTYIENEFNITLSNSDFEIDNFRSVDAIVTLIESKM